MVVTKVKGGYKIKHSQSGKKGFVKATPKPVSKRKAQQIHRAIQSSKAKRGKK